MSEHNGNADSRAAGARAHPRGLPLRAGHAREHGRRRARLAGGDARAAHGARQGRADVHRAERAAAAARVPLLRQLETTAGGDPCSSRDQRPDIARAHRRSSWTAATSTATPPQVLRDGAHLLNIDHHHDNTHFGTLDHVVPSASCTAEIVWDLMSESGRRADRRPSPRRCTSG